MNDRRATELGLKAGRVPRCEVSGKIQYRTRRKALRRNGQMTTSTGVRASDAYVCRHCGFWHITRPVT